ncbi:MAG: cupredoxin domain-containing protein [Methanoregulaceae archaeon]|nr:cupredoxin domain-containing protein [Methanoregulaceae archaeon]
MYRNPGDWYPDRYTPSMATVQPATTPATTAQTTTEAMTTPQPATTTAPGKIILDLVVAGFAFNASTITFPAGAAVTLNFENQDAGVPHKFALYDTSAMGRTFFKGQQVTGAGKTVYTFAAPSSPGSYHFQCDPPRCEDEREVRGAVSLLEKPVHGAAR